MNIETKNVDKVVIRFAGDSGDGMQLTGTRFTETTAIVGNDLSTAIPEYNFAGLKEGDLWCLCASRWKEAYECGFAPKIYLKRTNKKALKIIDFDILKSFAIDLT